MVKIKNKPMFWTGLSFQIAQVLAVGIWLLTRLDWSWLTMNVVRIALVALAWLIYNGISVLLIWQSTKK